MNIYHLYYYYPKRADDGMTYEHVLDIYFSDTDCFQALHNSLRFIESRLTQMTEVVSSPCAIKLWGVDIQPICEDGSSGTFSSLVFEWKCDWGVTLPNAILYHCNKYQHGSTRWTDASETGKP